MELQSDEEFGLSEDKLSTEEREDLYSYPDTEAVKRVGRPLLLPRYRSSDKSGKTFPFRERMNMKLLLSTFQGVYLVLVCIVYLFNF